MGRQNRRAAHNSTLAIGGVSSPLDSFEVAESCKIGNKCYVFPKL